MAQLQWNQSPDVASLLQQDYNAQNENLAANEELERMNDAQRLENAKWVEELGPLISKGKKTVDKVQEYRKQRQVNYYRKLTKNWSAEQRLKAVEKYEANQEAVLDELKVREKIGDQIPDKNAAVDFISESEYRKGRHGFLQAQVLHLGLNLPTSFQDFAGDVSNLDGDQLAFKLDEFKNKIIGDVSYLPPTMIEGLENKIDTMIATQMSEKNTAITEATLAGFQADDEALIINTLKGTDGEEFNKSMLSLIDLKTPPDGTFSDGVKSIQETILRLVENNQMSVVDARKFETIAMKHRGIVGKDATLLSLIHI